ncbi:hypothetical protein GIB67_042129 [Kingdonia uniflora]|uniref:Cytochrome P450 n=1 Tax=Kingdonia uniflora TaxID=39325 RepID=A0A7J7NPE3_9MAGN|nr:hypothetical protein GIB67_042129 [Kingdonia uniflora]
MQEIMQLNPPTFGSTRITTKDTKFCGFDILKGWRVASSTHMDANIFPELEKFDPSRFDNTSKAVVPFTYLPFGGGLHICHEIGFA